MNKKIRIKDNETTLSGIIGATFEVVDEQKNHYYAKLIELGKGKSLKKYEKLNKKVVIDRKPVLIHKNHSEIIEGD